MTPSIQVSHGDGREQRGWGVLAQRSARNAAHSQFGGFRRRGLRRYSGTPGRQRRLARHRAALGAAGAGGRALWRAKPARAAGSGAQLWPVYPCALGHSALKRAWGLGRSALR